MIVEVLSKIGFDWKLALANMVNFLIIFWILKRFIWSPVSEAIEIRKKTVNESASSLKLAEEKLEKAEADSRAILAEAHKKAKHVTDRAEEKGNEIMLHFQLEAQKEKERIIENGMEEISRKEREARTRIQEEAVDMVVSGAQKLIDEEISEEIKTSFARKMASYS